MPQQLIYAPCDETQTQTAEHDIELQQWHDEVYAMELEQWYEQEGKDPWDDYFTMWDDICEEAQRLTDHKQAYSRRFRKLRNQRHLPIRRYGNAFDGFEGRRNDPMEHKLYRKALASIREEELTEPLRALQEATLQYGSLKRKAARRELTELGYNFNWRKTVDRRLAKNNEKQHALCEPEKDFWAYSDNPYGKTGYEPAWRKIGTYSPDTDLLQQVSVQARKSNIRTEQLVYDRRTSSYVLPTPNQTDSQELPHHIGSSRLRWWWYQNTTQVI